MFPARTKRWLRRRPKLDESPRGNLRPKAKEPTGLTNKHLCTENNLTDPQPNGASRLLEAAMCVRKSSVRRVLQFTPINAASCVLHRPVSRVIHRLQLCKLEFNHRNGPHLSLLVKARLPESQTEAQDSVSLNPK